MIKLKRKGMSEFLKERREYILADVILKTKGVLWKVLTQVYGIGIRRASIACIKVGIPTGWNIREMERYQFTIIRKLFFINFYLGERLIWEGKANIRRYTESFSKRGLLYLSGLPVNGQRTKTNGKTAHFEKTERFQNYGNKKLDEMIHGKNTKGRLTKRRLRTKKKRSRKYTGKKEYK